jgi:hypothetical protein
VIFHRLEIEGAQHRVPVAGDERDPVGRVDEQAVVVVAAWEWNASGDAVGSRVDDREVVAGLDVREYEA